jgi:hypothetical protein
MNWLALFTLAIPGAIGSIEQPLTRTPISDISIESGPVTMTGDLLAIRRPVIRATVPGSGSAARIAFSYLGPSKETEPLASGELRRQIGLKLRARDTCNVIYVMWRIAPTGGIYVQTKLNPKARTHAQCRDQGYEKVKGTQETVPAAIREGERRFLTALLTGRRLRVFTDGSLAWQGTLPGDVLALEGPVGMRSDNGNFDVELWTDKPTTR